MKRKYLILVAIIISILLILFMSTFKYDILRHSQPEELRHSQSEELRYSQPEKLIFTVTPEKTRIQEGEVFQINLVVTNVGENSINVWKMYEQTSYNIFFFNHDGSIVPYEGGVNSRVPLIDRDLVELNPGESLDDTFDSTYWNLTKGEYILNAVYDTTSPDEDIKKPYWIGRINSNNVTITVE